MLTFSAIFTDTYVLHTRSKTAQCSSVMGEGVKRYSLREQERGEIGEKFATGAGPEDFLDTAGNNN